MNEVEYNRRITAACLRLGLDEALKRLEGTPPAGSLPASGSGARGAAPDQTRDTCSSSAPPFGGQATGELQRLLQRWEKRAAKYEERYAHYEGKGMYNAANYADGLAAGLRDAIADLKAEAVGEPRAQSERNRVGCPHLRISMSATESPYCADCGEAVEFTWASNGQWSFVLRDLAESMERELAVWRHEVKTLREELDAEREKAISIFIELHELKQKHHDT